MRRSIPIFFLCMGIMYGANAQNAESSESQLPDPKIAFLKSLAVPGWGHHYADKSNWTRGQYHLAAEAALIISYAGLRWHAQNLQHNWYTYAQTSAGVNIKDRERGFRLAVGDFENLEAYNSYQERTRNWNMLYEENPQNRWSWRDETARNKYQNLRERFEHIDQQLPALISLMVVNRIVSAVSAYNRARKKQEAATAVSLYFSPYRGQGFVADLRITF
ncbi:MAG: hypothetical protein U5K69_16815 [Balneolaceae bacterium]|nr:hypothetical protein [Balneolaceae bacterium]